MRHPDTQSDVTAGKALELCGSLVEHSKSRNFEYGRIAKHKVGQDYVVKDSETNEIAGTGTVISKTPYLGGQGIQKQRSI